MLAFSTNLVRMGISDGAPRNNQLRVVHQRTRDGHALLRATAELSRQRTQARARISPSHPPTASQIETRSTSPSKLWQRYIKQLVAGCFKRRRAVARVQEAVGQSLENLEYLRLFAKGYAVRRC